MEQKYQFDPQYAVQVIGKYVPESMEETTQNINAIAAAIERITERVMPIKLTGISQLCGRLSSIQLDESAHPWHVDGPKACEFCILWASSTPTEVQFAGGCVYSAQPYEILAIDNRLVFHRAPAKAYATGQHRLFVVGRIETVDLLPEFSTQRAYKENLGLRCRNPIWGTQASYNPSSRYWSVSRD